MNHDHQHKITAQHLKRHAYLYVRQSTLRQVFENTESTQRQYVLRDRAVALGWPLERVIIIDSDLGNPALRLPTGKVSSVWYPRWAWDTLALSWAWKSHAWPATVPTGTVFWRSAL